LDTSGGEAVGGGEPGQEGGVADNKSIEFISDQGGRVEGVTWLAGWEWGSRIMRGYGLGGGTSVANPRRAS